MNSVSLNNRFIVEPYKGERALKSKNEGGFALVQQKTSVVGLKLLVDVTFNNANNSCFFAKGSTIYVKEELLFTQQWGAKAYESDAIEGRFLIIDGAHVEFVVEEE